MWLFLWVLIVLGAAGFFLWSYHELFEQKRLWKSFAAKYNLHYVGGRFQDSPTMTGELKGRNVNFYPQMMENAQSGMMTCNVIEVFLNEVPSISCLVANAGFSDFIASVDLPEPFEVRHPAWPQGILSRKFEEDQPEKWFEGHDGRVTAIQNLSKLPFHVAFVADGEQAFVAIRTANPLNDDKKFNLLLKKLYDIVAMLEVSDDASIIGGNLAVDTSQNKTEQSNMVSNDAVEEIAEEEGVQRQPEDDPNLPPISPDNNDTEENDTYYDNDTKPLL